ncbi:TolC family protein [Sediminibacterium sp. WSJ-3]|nr:TolC family protein [Sediminibacterium soli]
MKRKLIFILSALLSVTAVRSQDKLSLSDVLSAITANHPDLKGFDAQIRSLDEVAKGAKNWERPLLSTGLWMTPYNPAMWKKQADGAPGMGQYMISAEQMLPNTSMQNAALKYMQGMSAVEKERKNAAINELYAQARKNFYQWVVIKKKLKVLAQDEKVLDFMIKDAELRYRNNLGKISAYYKAKASLGNIQTMRIMLENDIIQKRISLNTLINRDKNLVFDIDTSYTIREYPSVQFDSATLATARSDIKAIDREIQLTALQQDVEKAKQKPEYGVRFDHMFGFGGLPMQYSLMGMVKLPIGKSTRASKANIEGLKWKTESLNQQKLGLINEAAGMAEGMKNEIASRKKQIAMYESNIIPALRKNFQTMQLAYQNNTEELFALYDAWETVNMTQLQYLDQLQQLLIMQAELERILEVK